MRLRQTAVSAAALTAVGVAIGLVVAAAIQVPRIAVSSPAADSSGVPAKSPVRLTFSKPMNRSSVESHLTIEPSQPGSLSWVGTTLVFRPEVPWPVQTTVKVKLAAGALSARRLPLLRTHAFQFTIGAPRLSYLWPAGGKVDLYAVSPDGGDAARQTEASYGLLDYSLSADGTTAVYTALRGDGGTELHQLDLASREDRVVYLCSEGAVCQAPELSPDGRWLAFEQSEPTIGAAGRSVRGPVRVWLVSMNGEGGAILLGPEDHVTSQPEWSPLGLLAYYDHSLKAIALVDVDGDGSLTPTNFIPSELGIVGAWAPAGNALVFSEMILPAEDHEGLSGPEFYMHLYRAEARSDSLIDLSAGSSIAVEDASPAFSPDGNWIAFARKFLNPGEWTLGRQIWLMRPDGSGARPLTSSPEYNHSGMTWSPDSNSIAYMKLNQAEIGQPAEIWITNRDGSGAHRVVEGGYLPRWIP